MAPSSRLVELIDWYQAAHPAITDAEIARRLGVSRANISQWRSVGVRGWPARSTLDALASAIDRPYGEILDAALADAGYADTRAPVSVTNSTYQEVLDSAIRALSEATRLTNQPVRQKPDGTWEPDRNAEALPIDWAAFVTTALAAAAANAGGIDAVLAGRPGSWEAGVVRDVLTAAVGDDESDLWRYRTEPLKVIINPEEILSDIDSSTWFADVDAAEAELTRRENAISPGQVYDHPGHELSEEARRYYTGLGFDIVDGPPPPLPTPEELAAASESEREDPTVLSPDEQAKEDALEAINELRGRLEAQQIVELADYGDRLAQAVRERLKQLQLPVPVVVIVDHDGQANTPERWATDAVNTEVAAAIAATPRPDSLPGTPLERAERAR